MASLHIQQNLASTLPPILPANFLKEITSDFSPNREVIGPSVFGRLYKGIISDGSMFAVKRLAENAPVATGNTFNYVVTNLMALKHENIVQLVGFCHEPQRKVINHGGRYVLVETTETCLCYEYPPNGSLDKHLYADTSSMGWDTRFKIIKGICQGLNFLHNNKELDGPLVHMNLVPNSIWLDDNWVPKIADFGLSRLFGQEQTRMYTVNVMGQNGYMAPEYLYRGEISTMTDIYSLGMLIIEITTGEKNSAGSEDRAARKFVDNVHQYWKTDEQIKLKYPSLNPNGLQQVKACIVIGLKCVEADRKRRPSIVDIVDRLNGKRVPIFDQMEESSQGVVSSWAMEKSSEDAALLLQMGESSQAKVKATERPDRRSSESVQPTGTGPKIMADVEWALDTRACIHRTINVQLLRDVTANVDDMLPPEEDSPPILGRGSVQTESFNVPQVSHIEAEGETMNVISVAQLARSHGLITVFEPTCCFVRDPETGKDVGRGQLRDGVYVLDYLLINQKHQDAIDASRQQGIGAQELQGEDRSRPQLEWPEKHSWFGIPKFDRAKSSTIADIFTTSSSPHERRGTTAEFHMDSGACHHMTWNGDVLNAYHDDLHVGTPMQYVHSGAPKSSHLAVDGIGYIDSKGGSLDRVLFVPATDTNLISVSQLTKDYSVRVVFRENDFWIERTDETQERIGHGHLVGNNYVLAHLDVGAASDWVLNSFAWFHYTPNRHMLYNLQEKTEGLPPVSRGKQPQILRHGSVQTERFKVPGVCYVKEDTRNIISVVQLAKQHGMVTVFGPTSCHVKDKETGQIVGKGCLRKGNYVLQYLQIDQQDRVLGGQTRGGSDGGQGGGDGEGGNRTGMGDRGHGAERGGGAGRGGDDDREKEGGKGDDMGEDKREEEEEEEEEEDNDDDDEEILPDSEDQHGHLPAPVSWTNETRPDDFLVDSGACFHVTRNERILFLYPAHLRNSTRPPIPSMRGVFEPTQEGVGLIQVTDSGYLNGNNIMLDGVLLAPRSQMNLVSSGQLALQYGVNVENCLDVKIKKISDGSLVGQGYMNEWHQYVLEYFRPNPQVLYAHSPEHYSMFFGDIFGLRR